MYTFLHKRKILFQKGFTLVELMVSVSIFAIVMMISTGTLLVLIDVNSKAQAVYSATSNLAFVLDSLSREIRSGHTFYCDNRQSFGSSSQLPGSSGNDRTNDCDNAIYIVFTRERDGERVGYRIYEDQGTTPTSQKIQMKEGTSNWIDLTSEDVFIETFSVSVSGSEPGDDDQPLIRLVLKGYVVNGLNTETRFNIQTYMVPRILNTIL